MDDDKKPNPNDIDEEEKDIELDPKETEIDIAPTTEIDTVEDSGEPQEEVDEESDRTEDTAAPVADSSDDQDNTWIAITDGKFQCSECENEVEPETNTIEGVVKADLNQIDSDLEQFPTKVIYGICPVCGMEFVFRRKEDKLFLQPSDLEK